MKPRDLSEYRVEVRLWVKVWGSTDPDPKWPSPKAPATEAIDWLFRHDSDAIMDWDVIRVERIHETYEPISDEEVRS
jgi:hypothetical protein